MDLINKITSVFGTETKPSKQVSKSVPEKKENTQTVYITESKLKAAMPKATMQNIKKYVVYMNKYFPMYGITTNKRIAMFIAQIAVESKNLSTTKEAYNGNAESYFTKMYWDNKNVRKNLGNIKKTDAYSYSGRGLIQLTGRYNYEWISKQTFGNDSTYFVENPGKIASDPEMAVRSACAFFSAKGCLVYADRGDIKGCTKVINGGYNALSERISAYKQAKIGIGA